MKFPRLQHRTLALIAVIVSLLLLFDFCRDSGHGIAKPGAVAGLLEPTRFQARADTLPVEVVRSDPRAGFRPFSDGRKVPVEVHATPAA